MLFKEFKDKVDNSFQQMCKGQSNLFRAKVDKDLLWNTYLESFPEEERQEHNCNCCRQFIKNWGNVVAIKNNKVITFWDVECEEPYNTVAANLKKLILAHPVTDLLVQTFPKLGTDKNTFLRADGTVGVWNHLFTVLPEKFIYRGSSSEDTVMSDFRSTYEVFTRSLNTITPDAVAVVLELIEQNSLYRGLEFKKVVEEFQTLQNKYNKLPQNEKNAYIISHVKNSGVVARIRNSAIGTLLVDLSEGVDLDTAVTKFEKVVAPTNYKRPTAVVTKSMIEAAQKKVKELGIEKSLSRDYAKLDDITVNNVLFVNRDLSEQVGIFDKLKENIVINPKKFSKVEEIGIEDFISKVLPTAKSVQVLLEQKHEPNLVTLTKSKYEDAPNIFKWNNNFAWAYNGNLADSIKEKVKKAGGNVNGVLRCSLHWFNYDDLDIHVVEPHGAHIYYSDKYSNSSGMLDVDMNAGSRRESRDAVENIVWTNSNKMVEGVYTLYINNFYKKEWTDEGFECEIECNGELHKFSYERPVRDKENVKVCTFKWSRKLGITEIAASIPEASTNISKEIWGINTNKFQKVSMIMLSPNYWDNQSIGNKHYFFMLEGCRSSEKTRGFFNEYLKESLNEHRKVFEILGNNLLLPTSLEQLSGLGFSSTVRNELICKVEGSFERIIKVKF